MIRNTTNTVIAWSNAEPDEISKRFHNMLIRVAQSDPRLWNHLINLWAVPMGRHQGRYCHHDGWRCP